VTQVRYGDCHRCVQRGRAVSADLHVLSGAQGGTARPLGVSGASGHVDLQAVDRAQRRQGAQIIGREGSSNHVTPMVSSVAPSRAP